MSGTGHSDRTRQFFTGGGVLILALVWTGPLPSLLQGPFAAHMAMHVAVVALAAPLLATGMGGTRLDPLRRLPGACAPVAASLTEMTVVWIWHAPALHLAARESAVALGVEQTLFLVSGLWVWLTAFGGIRPVPVRRATGAGALLFTSMHMTLLGVLLALAPRPLYAHGGAPGIDPMFDQHLGGVFMLAGAGLSYLAGALVLLAGLVGAEPREGRR